MDNYDLQVDIARKLFLAYDQAQMIRKFCLNADAQYIYLTYLNTPCRISRSSGSIEEKIHSIWQECRNYSTVMTIYDLLCYHKGQTLPALSDQWCTVGNFVVTGVTQTETFTKKFAKCFDGHLAQLKTACKQLGGVLQPPVAGADLTCKIQVTPFFPVLLQFWEGDEEFPPKLLLLWDRNTDQFLHFETTFYLQGDLLERLKNCMEDAEIDLHTYIEKSYGVTGEYLFAKDPATCVFRHRDNRKWFGVIMEIPKAKLDIQGVGTIRVINLKCDPRLIGSFRMEQGIYPAYHMSKAHWLTVALDGTVAADKLKFLVQMSYDLTKGRRK